MAQSQPQLVRLHTGPLRAWQLASLRCSCPIRSRPLAAPWDSSIHHRRYNSQASTSSPCLLLLVEAPGAWGLREAMLCRILLPSSFGPELIRGSGFYTVLLAAFHSSTLLGAALGLR